MLDPLTLQIIMSVVAFPSAAATFVLWLLNRSEEGIAFWAAAGILAGGIFPLSSYIGDIGMFINMAVPLTAALLLLEGTLRFRGWGGLASAGSDREFPQAAGKRRWRVRKYALPFLIALFVVFSYLFRNNAAPRLLFSDAAFVIMLASISLAMLYGTSGAERIVHMIVVLPCIFLAAVIAWRWYLAFSGAVGTEPPSFTKYVFLAYIPWILGWTYAICMAVMFRKNRRISEMAARDDLTGLANRRSFNETIEVLIERASSKSSLGSPRSADGSFVLFLMDVNGFKSINDAFGHSYGDRVLRLMADAIRESIREDDFAARFGGDEFLVLMRSKADARDVDMLKKRLKESVERERILDGIRIRLRVSVGVAVFPYDGTTIDELLLAADHRMYEEKVGDRLMSEIVRMRDSGTA